MDNGQGVDPVNFHPANWALERDAVATRHVAG